jgi:hypothetical protein
MDESARQSLSNKRRRKIMTMKYILAVALVAPFLTVSSMAQDAPYTFKHVYQGGPKSAVAHTTRQITNDGSIYAFDVNAKTPHAYRGGPRTVVPHSN